MPTDTPDRPTFDRDDRPFYVAPTPQLTLTPELPQRLADACTDYFKQLVQQNNMPQTLAEALVLRFHDELLRTLLAPPRPIGANLREVEQTARSRQRAAIGQALNAIEASRPFKEPALLAFEIVRQLLDRESRRDSGVSAPSPEAIAAAEADETLPRDHAQRIAAAMRIVYSDLPTK